MNAILPQLLYEDLLSTRDYLQETALVLSSLQRGFVAKHPRQWQYGLEVTLRGLSTQPFKIGGQEMRAGLDLVKHKVRLGGSKWPLHEYAPPEIMNNIKAWLQSRGALADLEEPKFASGVKLYDTAQAEAYAEVLWWMDQQFRDLKDTLNEGVTSPILLYPHHFDLSLVWFPFDDERQLAVGFSTGDETIPEPYLYLTASPEPAGFTSLVLPPGAYWQPVGFSGAILPYAALQASEQPEFVIQDLMTSLFARARQLF